MGNNANMTIKTFLKVASLLPTETSVLLRGDHGIGKSQLVRQVAILREQDEFDGIYRPVIDRRLAQMTEGDMIGLPVLEGESTTFRPPDWFVKACKEPCILLLDELNRANIEIMQAAFQIVLDREMSGMKLHKDTMVFAAINTASIYSVNEVDPALLDRFFVVDLIPEVDDWMTWAKSTNSVTNRTNVHPLFVDFIIKNQKWLDTPKNSEPQDVTTSRRSWEKLSNAAVEMGLVDELSGVDDENQGIFFSTCMGFVGREAAIAVLDFVKNYDKVITAEDVLERFTTKKVQNKLGDDPSIDVLNSLIEKVSDYVVENLDAVNTKQGKNLKSFMEILPAELRIDLWKRLTKCGVKKEKLAISIHKHCVELILGVFGVPLGEKGIGVTPNIPGFLQKSA